MLTGRQKRALAALLSASTVREAADSAGIGYQTLRFWLANNSEFRRAYNEQLQGLITDTAAQLKKNMGEAVSTMAQIMGDKSVNAQTRLNASDALLRQSLKFIEAVDILERLEKIEGRLDDERD